MIPVYVCKCFCCNLNRNVTFTSSYTTYTQPIVCNKIGNWLNDIALFVFDLPLKVFFKTLFIPSLYIILQTDKRRYGIYSTCSVHLFSKKKFKKQVRECLKKFTSLLHQIKCNLPLGSYFKLGLTIGLTSSWTIQDEQNWIHQKSLNEIVCSRWNCYDFYSTRLPNFQFYWFFYNKCHMSSPFQFNGAQC
jgi:hypothetical protein